MITSCSLVGRDGYTSLAEAKIAAEEAGLDPEEAKYYWCPKGHAHYSITQENKLYRNSFQIPEPKTDEETTNSL